MGLRRYEAYMAPNLLGISHFEECRVDLYTQPISLVIASAIRISRINLYEEFNRDIWGSQVVKLRFR